MTDRNEAVPEAERDALEAARAAEQLRAKDWAERLRRDRRERIATAVLAGIAAHGPLGPDLAPGDARVAVAYADALIAALDG